MKRLSDNILNLKNSNWISFSESSKQILSSSFKSSTVTWDIFHTSSECEYTASPSESASIKKRIAIAAGEPSKRSKRKKPIRWTGKEDAALLEGIEKYTIGEWTKIYNEFKETFDENGRGPGSLKDRYRTLMENQNWSLVVWVVSVSSWSVAILSFRTVAADTALDRVAQRIISLVK